MKLPNSGILNLARTAQGAIIEPGDGELILPPILQPVAFVGDPLESLQPHASTFINTRSFMATLNRNRSGAGALDLAQICTFGKGIWHVTTSWTIAWYNATTNGNEDILYLYDPGGNPLPLNTFFRQANAIGIGQTLYTNNFFSFGADGFNIRILTAAMNALETLYTEASVVANKLA